MTTPMTSTPTSTTTSTPTPTPSTTTTPTPRYRGIFPVVPTPFTESGELDLPSQKRAVDFMIDSGVDGLCILANFSEQFVLSDDEREVLTRAILEHVAGRVPVIVTTTHFSTRVCAARSRRAQDQGAAMLMIMPPYHGATIRVPEAQVEAFFQQVSDAVDIPIMIQDAPVAGTPLSAALLAKMAREIEQVSYFKIETAGAASKLRDLIALGGAAVEGPWDGEEAITLLPDLDAGATGSMTGGGFADGIRPIIQAHRVGQRDEAYRLYERWLPLINYENRQGGILTAKALMQAGGVIACDAPRHPFPAMRDEVRQGLLETARRLDPLVLRWGR
jgi:dihydrodipicolinate synthase/N-acetylneuraminate lyase